MLDQPRTAGRSKSKGKRESAPPALLASQVRALSPKASTNTAAAADDFLGLFSNKEKNAGGDTKKSGGGGVMDDEKEGVEEYEKKKTHERVKTVSIPK